MFGQLNPTTTITQLQQKFANLFAALGDVEDAYQWISAYALSDLEAAPLNLSSDDGQAILNALADAHDLYQTSIGTTGFPTASVPYNFLASMRMINGAR